VSCGTEDRTSQVAVGVGSGVLRELVSLLFNDPHVSGGITCLLKTTKALLAGYRVIKDVARSVYIHITLPQQSNTSLNSPPQQETIPATPSHDPPAVFLWRSVDPFGRPIPNEGERKNDHTTPRPAAAGLMKIFITYTTRCARAHNDNMKRSHSTI